MPPFKFPPDFPDRAALSPSLKEARTNYHQPALDSRTRARKVFSGNYTPQGTPSLRASGGKPKEEKRSWESRVIEDGYHHAFKALKSFHLLKPDEEPPDFDRVLKVFTPDMLMIARDFQDPKLILAAKDCSFEDLTDAIDAHKFIGGQRDVFVEASFLGRDYRKKSKYWGAYIIEGPIDVAVQDDDAELVLSERLERFQNRKEGIGFGGMDRWKYAHLMLQTLPCQRALDISTWTILDEENALLSGKSVPGAAWVPDRSSRRVSFSMSHQSHDRHARFRRSVGGYL